MWIVLQPIIVGVQKEKCEPTPVFVSSVVYSWNTLIQTCGTRLIARADVPMTIIMSQPMKMPDFLFPGTVSVLIRSVDL